MEYNTNLKKLVLPEYGRNIQMMVDHMKTVEDRDTRNRMANEVISIMGNLNPHLRDIADFKHKLWDHLMIMADFDLDIDSPYPPPKKEVLSEKPNKVPYNTNRIRYRYYGVIMEKMIKAYQNLETDEEKQELIKILANHMKKSYLTWNKDHVEDQFIANDINELSNGHIKVETSDLALKYMRTAPPKTNKKKRPARNNKGKRK